MISITRIIQNPAWDLIPQLDVFVMVSKPYYPLNMLVYRWLATLCISATQILSSIVTIPHPSIIPHEHLLSKYGGFLAKIILDAFMEAAELGAI